MFDTLNTKLKHGLGIAALAIMVGLFDAATTYAQEEAATEVADTATAAVEEEDEGFDWGLLGLLGLLGLGGLLKKNDDTRVTTTPVGRTADRDLDNTVR